MSMHITEDAYFVEVLDPDTWTPVPDGQRGVLVCTNLWAQANPFLRYAVGDYLTVTNEPCSCGRTGRRVVGGFTGRPDDMVKIRGVPVFPSMIEALVRNLPQLGDEFEMVISTEVSGAKELTVRAELVDDSGREAQLINELEERIRTHVGIRARVELVPFQTLPRAEFKAKRVRHVSRAE